MKTSAGVVASAPIIPLIATAGVSLSYIARHTGSRALLEGLIAAGCVWVVLAIGAGFFVGVSTANHSVYRDLQSRLRALRGELVGLDYRASEVPEARHALAAVTRALDELEEDLVADTKKMSDDHPGVRRPTKKGESSHPRTDTNA